ncbi:MAG: MBL fold metallo-hydrolase [bacterium]|nr:MBL fold metallo-hydrolase [bacterium]
MIEVCSLSSGSNGNCFYIKTGSESFLVDAGISCRQVCNRLLEIGSSIDEINAIFVTHEHSDHTRGLKVLLNKHTIPVYITEQTFHRSNFQLDEEHLHFIDRQDEVAINGTLIKSLPKSHDAVDPILFCIYYKGRKVSVVTDAGYACQNVIEAVRDAHVVFLEFNYDDTMLWEGYYPHYLKQRISSDQGHLSNSHAAELLIRHASPNLSHLFLSHLSENNNSPDIAMEACRSAIHRREDLGNLTPLLTSRREVSPIVKLDL